MNWPVHGTATVQDWLPVIAPFTVVVNVGSLLHHAGTLLISAAKRDWLVVFEKASHINPTTEGCPCFAPSQETTPIPDRVGW